MISPGDSYKESFSFDQEAVLKFAEISGDFNPLHLDENYAAGTPFKKPIIHGFLGGSIFSKILGMKFPGEGTVYLRQSLEFKRPMFVEIEYEATITVKEIDAGRNTALMETIVTEKSNNKLIITGEALVMNKQKIV